MPWGFAAAAVGSVVGGAISSSGAQSAAQTQANAQTQAANTQLSMFNTINGQEQPFIQGGYAANTALQNDLGLSGNTGAAGYGSLTKNFTGADYLANQDPGYQFQLQTGAQALRNSDTPGVGSLSGQALKDLMTFNQGTAATGYQNAFNRFQTQNSNTYARLSGIAGMGQNAASNVGTAGTSLGTGAAQAQAAAGGSLASGTLGSASALAGTANTIGGLAYLQGTNGTNNNVNSNMGGEDFGATNPGAGWDD